MKLRDSKTCSRAANKCSRQELNSRLSRSKFKVFFFYSRSHKILMWAVAARPKGLHSRTGVSKPFSKFLTKGHMR